ncbi:MAG: 50S ribosomal protein L10 [Actinomycetota bacterium]|nr:50S ribosomal protein L10 [Actinomycetota bacterium]
MARPDKVAAVTQVRERFEGSTAAVLTEYRGLTVAELADLRAELRQSGADYKVVKNTLTRRAVADAGYDVPDEMFTGPTAVTFCPEDPVAAAKVLRSFMRTHPHLVVKGGILEGRLIDAAETLSLADLASREELLARMAGLMEAIVAQPARLALASLSKAARLFAALADKKPAQPVEPAEPSDSAEPDAQDADAAVAAEASPGDPPDPEAVAEPAEGDADTDQ